MRLIPSLLLATCFCTTAAIGTAQSNINISNQNRTLAVTATDSVSAFADTAVVHVGFEAYGADEQSAYATGSQRSNAIVNALTGAGVTKDKIESENQQLAPLNDYEVQHPSPARTGMRFRLQQSWTVHTHPDDAARLLDIAVKAGANQSGSIDWEMADTAALESQAAAKALAHAQSIAAGMAEGLHAKLGPLLYASNQAQEHRPVPQTFMRAMKADAAAPVAPLALANRKVERSATVYAVFQIE